MLNRAKYDICSEINSKLIEIARRMENFGILKVVLHAASAWL